MLKELLEETLKGAILFNVEGRIVSTDTVSMVYFLHLVTHFSI